MLIAPGRDSRQDDITSQSLVQFSMKILFSSPDRSQITSLRKKLFDAGIPCRVRKNPVAQGVFGTPPLPELWIRKDGDILKALKLLGAQRLQEMTVIFPGA